jgi:lipoprotein-releasing system permease protein
VKPYELLIGLRYTHAKRRNNFISFISFVSMAGIVLGVAALIIVLSVMNGFQEELRTRILGVVSHVEVTGSSDTLPDWQKIAERVKANPEVLSSAPFVNNQGMLALGGNVRGALIRGILPEAEAQVTDLAADMRLGKLGDLKPGEWGIVLGVELAQALGAGVGDKLTVITPQGNITPAGVLPRMKQFTVTGIFKAGHNTYDSGLALIHLQDAQKLARMGDDVSGLRLKIHDIFRAPGVTRELATLLPDHFISDWTTSNANFFRAVAIEKRMMFLILLIIVLVAAFNIVSTLVMAVTDKQSDIAILRTLGARPSSIMEIFIIQGAFIGVLGTLAGVTMGVLGALNLETVVPVIERIAGVDLFPADVYYISKLPSKLVWSDVGTIAGISLILALLATLYPSWRASRLNPAESLRYE